MQDNRKLVSILSERLFPGRVYGALLDVKELQALQVARPIIEYAIKELEDQLETLQCAMESIDTDHAKDSADRVIAEMDVPGSGRFMGVDCERFTKKQLIKIMSYNQKAWLDGRIKP